jgi:hypothetical protein
VSTFDAVQPKAPFLTVIGRPAGTSSSSKQS